MNRKIVEKKQIVRILKRICKKFQCEYCECIDCIITKEIKKIQKK